MIIEKFGKKVLKDFIIETGIVNSANFNKLFNKLDECAAAKNIVDKVVKTVEILSRVSSHLRPEEEFTEYEYVNAEWVLAALLRLDISYMPTYINSNFLLVKKIAHWRLKINR